MCDYSTKHLESVKVEAGQTYKADSSVTHGFLTMESTRDAIVAVCVVDGQKLALRSVSWISAVQEAYRGVALPRSCTVTVVQMRKHPIRESEVPPMFGKVWNDFVELPDGKLVPVAYIARCRMTLVPAKARAARARKKSLTEKLGLDPANLAAVAVDDSTSTMPVFPQARSARAGRTRKTASSAR